MRFAAICLVLLVISAIDVVIAEDLSMRNGTIYGHVYDADTKQPLSQAFVYCQEVKCQKPLTDKQGYYAIEGCFSPSKTYTIKCSRNGYQTSSESAETDKNGNTKVDFELTSEAANQPPVITSLTPDKTSPLIADSSVSWTAEATDQDNDQILYKFFLDGNPMSGWITSNKWIWQPTDTDVGDHQIEVIIRDGKHANSDSYDGSKTAKFTIKRKDKDYWLQKGHDLYGQYNFEEAINSVDKAIEIDSGSGDAWRLKGKSLQQLGRKNEAIESYDEALKAYNSALSADPDNLNLLIGKGSTLVDLGRNKRDRNQVDEAIKAYDKALEIDPDSSKAWSGKGVAYYYLGKFDESIKAYDKAVELDPADDMTLWNKGETLYYMGKFEEAIKSYDRAIEIDPNNAFAWNGKGDALKELGRISEADSAFAKAKELGYK